MKLGSLNIILFIFLFFFGITYLAAQEKLNLQDLEPTFEEESDVNEFNKNEESSKIRSKEKKNLNTTKTVVKLRALDKITARTSDIDIVLGKKRKFGYLEILAKKCKQSIETNNKGVVAYIQVKDLSEKRDNKVFVFNGWTFSSGPTIKTFDHPVYDLWVTGCENI